MVFSINSVCSMHLIAKGGLILMDVDYPSLEFRLNFCFYVVESWDLEYIP